MSTVVAGRQDASVDSTKRAAAPDSRVHSSSMRSSARSTSPSRTTFGSGRGLTTGARTGLPYEIARRRSVRSASSALARPASSNASWLVAWARAATAEIGAAAGETVTAKPPNSPATLDARGPVHHSGMPPATSATRCTPSAIDVPRRPRALFISASWSPAATSWSAVGIFGVQYGVGDGEGTECGRLDGHGDQAVADDDRRTQR